jgi:peptidoglycan/LPS O-acetylase OafA/YrhL
MLGDVSYSLYLTHGLIGGSTLYLLSRYAHSELEKIGLLLLALTISTVFSFIFWKWIEKPSKELSKRN